MEHTIQKKCSFLFSKAVRRLLLGIWQLSSGSATLLFFWFCWQNRQHHLVLRQPLLVNFCCIWPRGSILCFIQPPWQKHNSIVLEIVDWLRDHNAHAWFSQDWGIGFNHSIVSKDCKRSKKECWIPCLASLTRSDVTVIVPATVTVSVVGNGRNANSTWHFVTSAFVFFCLGFSSFTEQLQQLC